MQPGGFSQMRGYFEALWNFFSDETHWWATITMICNNHLSKSVLSVRSVRVFSQIRTNMRR